MKPIENINIQHSEKMISPQSLKEQFPMTDNLHKQIQHHRNVIRNILKKEDKRLIVVVGPCSIHDPLEALDYACKLRDLAEEVSDTMFIVMRVYFEKPRTTVGWKGLINDPDLDGSFNIEKGLITARKLLLDIAKLGLPIATEALDPITPQYLQDLITWSAIGARTTESQTHREMASGLSSYVGFKNATDGGLDVALHAIQSAANPHHFLGIDHEGHTSLIQTTGNQLAHIVLRGGDKGPNYDSVNVARVENKLMEANLPLNIMIDCSHDNSNKDYNLQPLVAKNVVDQVIQDNKSICGFMLESNIHEGNQKFIDKDSLEYGVSITDACISFSTTESLLLDFNEKLKFLDF